MAMACVHVIIVVFSVRIENLWYSSNTVMITLWCNGSVQCVCTYDDESLLANERNQVKRKP